MRNRRMQVNWYVQRLSTFEDYPVLLVVEKLAANVTIDHGALEAELRNGSFQLFRCRSGLGRRQCSESCKATRMRVYGLGQPIVGVRRHCNRRLGLETFTAGHR